MKIIRHSPRMIVPFVVSSVANVIIYILVLFPGQANAAAWLDYFRSLDLNDYALGVGFSSTQNIYKGSANSAYLYPYLTTFRNPAFTNDLLFASEGDLGLRYVSENQWTFSILGRIQTRSPDDNKDLEDLQQRRWTIETAPSIGYRGWPIHINFKTYFEILDRHKGTISNLEFSYPREWSRGYLIPTLDFIYQSRAYSQYYYSVNSNETAPGRPEYQAGSATNIAFRVKWGYALTHRWLVSGRVGLEILDNEISNSPIIDRNQAWTTSIKLAYNADVFQPRYTNKKPARLPRATLRVSIIDTRFNTTLIGGPSNTPQDTRLSLEDTLDVSDRETVNQFDFTLGLGTYHRLELSYSELNRSGAITIDDQLKFGDATFLPSTEVEAKAETSILRLAYGYFLIKDSQKELALIAGFHRTKFTSTLISQSTGERQRNSPKPILPVIGAFGTAQLGKHWSLAAEVQLFRMNFDQYNGALSYLRLDLLRQFNKFDLGIGYSFYGMNLESRDNDLRGKIKFRHQGPTLSGTFRF